MPPKHSVTMQDMMREYFTDIEYDLFAVPKHERGVLKLLKKFGIKADTGTRITLTMNGMTHEIDALSYSIILGTDGKPKK